jgi:hypothetical protein
MEKSRIAHDKKHLLSRGVKTEILPQMTMMTNKKTTTKQSCTIILKNNIRTTT